LYFAFKDEEQNFMYYPAPDIRGLLPPDDKISVYDIGKEATPLNKSTWRFIVTWFTMAGATPFSGGECTTP
jgi:hypothetical protein